VLLDLPITAAAQLETAIRATSQHLVPAGYIHDPRLSDKDFSRFQDWLADLQLMHTARLALDMFACAAQTGKLAAAAAATDLLQLAPRLHGLLVTSCKCYSDSNPKASRTESGKPNPIVDQWAGVDSCGAFLTALLASISFLALPADAAALEHSSSNSSSKKLATTRSCKQGSSTNLGSSSSSSSSSLALQLGPGSGPWLHIAGRVLLLLAQLLPLLPKADSRPEAQPTVERVQLACEVWSSICDRLQEQLRTLSLPGVSDVDCAKVGWGCRRAPAAKAVHFLLSCIFRWSERQALAAYANRVSALCMHGSNLRSIIHLHTCLAPLQVTSKLQRRVAAVQSSLQRWSTLRAATEEHSETYAEGACCGRDVNQCLAVEVPTHMQVC
jgi:hypothetical protein